VSLESSVDLGFKSVDGKIVVSQTSDGTLHGLYSGEGSDSWGATGTVLGVNVGQGMSGTQGISNVSFDDKTQNLSLDLNRTFSNHTIFGVSTNVDTTKYLFNVNQN